MEKHDITKWVEETYYNELDEKARELFDEIAENEEYKRVEYNLSVEVYRLREKYQITDDDFKNLCIYVTEESRVCEKLVRDQLILYVAKKYLANILR